MNFGNSAARLAPLLVARGARACIGFQDSFDDDLAELFFALFYSHLEQTQWNIGLAFRLAWERVRNESAHRQGTGVVLWCRDATVAPTVQDAQRQKELAARLTHIEKPLLSTAVPASEMAGLITVDVQPFADINYSVLHNRRRLFEIFSLKCQRPLRDVAIRVSLNVGTEAAIYERTLNIRPPAEDLKTFIHLPLTSALARTIQESILSSMLVEVTWGAHTLYRNTLPVRLTPVDQWRDNETDGRWLPSFVFPRDPAVSQIVETAQRYVRVLRDDPNSGFDGYQSYDARAADPSEEIDLQVQAIWSAMVHELRLGYINPPPAYSNELDSQRLRTPSTITKYHSGTCIDLALYFAACLELIDIYSVIFLLEGHAFPGYWRADAYLEQFKQARPENMDGSIRGSDGSNSGAIAQRDPWLVDKDSYGEIVQYVNAGKLVPLESVRLTENSGFWDAVEAGRENLRSKKEFHSMIDIALAREKQVTPLPILWERP